MARPQAQELETLDEAVSRNREAQRALTDTMELLVTDLMPVAKEEPVEEEQG